MNPLSLLLRLPPVPLLPLKGVIRLGQLIQDDAERQIAAPGRVRRELEDLEARMGELRDHFGLEPEDLNLDLGPLGHLSYE